MRILILDDDLSVAALLGDVLQMRFPDAEIVHRTTAEPGGRFDLYFFDDRFGNRQGMSLVAEIRVQAPRAVIIGYCGHLERSGILSLVNQGCDLIYEKGQAVLGDMVERAALLHAMRADRGGSKGFSTVLSSLLGLVRELKDPVSFPGQNGAEVAR